MGKIAFVFPGQGAQVPGMGLSAFVNSEAAKEIFKKIVNYDYAYSHIDAISLEEEGLIRCDEWWDESLAMDMYDGYDPIVDVIHISGTMMPYIYMGVSDA